MKRKSQTVQTGAHGKQDYETPDDFYNLAHKEFNFKLDLAATLENSKTPFWLGEGDNSLEVDWPTASPGNWMWLNPPFGHIEPWAKKCYYESMQGAKICMLTLASTGSNWFRNWCWNRCRIRFLKGRLKFKGCDSYFPKDLALYIYDKKQSPGTMIWDWKVNEFIYPINIVERIAA